MPLLAVGSLALDTIETPEKTATDVLGGSLTHFSAAASIFTKVRLVGVVGSDFPEEHLEFLRGRDVDLTGVEVKEGKTFRWWGRYHEGLNHRETVSVHLNVFDNFSPKIPAVYADSKFVFLGNGSPVTQASVLDGVDNPDFVLVDTMDLWIQTETDALEALLPRVDAITLNDEEIRLLTGEKNLMSAGRALLRKGPKAVILKKGEHGAMLISGNGTYLLPAFPTEEVRDPTGAGDSFAGGLMGYLAAQQTADFITMRKALRYGAVAASFNVEDFSLDRLRDVRREDLDRRLLTFLEHLAH